MSVETELRRSSIYYHSVKREELANPERYDQITVEPLRQILLNPSFSFSRICWGDMLWELYHTDECKRFGFNEVDRMISITFFQEILTISGLFLGQEIKNIQEGEKPQRIDPAPKYVTWSGLGELADKWKKEGLLLGGAHGAYDPPHVGHSRNVSKVWPYSDVLIVGFDSNAYLNKRKSKMGEERPRYPQLAWRMWEIASLPTVDYVFVIPINESDDDAFFEMYRRLNIKVLGTTDDHPLLPKYSASIAELGGLVVTDSEHPWSSTKTMRQLSDEDFQKRVVMSPESIHSVANRIEKEALKAGYLRDYPDGT